jgi:outer membrane protein
MKTTFLAAGLLLGLATARAQPVYRLEDCLELGLARSVAVANAEREREISEFTIRQIRGQTLPNLSASASYLRLGDPVTSPLAAGATLEQDQYLASATAEQLLFSGGSVRAALNAARSYRDQADEEIARAEAQSRRDITRAFYLALFRREAADVARASVELLSDTEAETRLKYDSGVLSEFEWLSARVRLANERPLLLAAENDHALARAALRNLLYLEDDAWSLDGAWPADDIAEVDLPDLIAHARTNRWELRQARVFLHVLEADIRVTRGDYFPEVKAFATYQGSDPSEMNPLEDGWAWQWLAGLRLTWNLWDGGERGALRAEKALKKVIAEDDITDLERTIDLEVETAFRNLSQARRAFEGADETITLAEKALDIARLRLERGLGTSLEFSDRNLELNKSRIQRLQNLLAIQHALADLTYACGGVILTRSPP